MLLLLIGCGLILSFQWRITLPDLSQVGHLRRRRELVRQTVHGVCDDALTPIRPPHRVGGLERYRLLLRSQLSRDAPTLRDLLSDERLGKASEATATVVLEYVGRAELCTQLSALAQQTRRAHTIWVVAMHMPGGGVGGGGGGGGAQRMAEEKEGVRDPGAEAREIIASFGFPTTGQVWPSSRPRRCRQGARPSLRASATTRQVAVAAAAARAAAARALARGVVMARWARKAAWEAAGAPPDGAAGEHVLLLDPSLVPTPTLLATLVQAAEAPQLTGSVLGVVGALSARAGRVRGGAWRTR